MKSHIQLTVSLLIYVLFSAAPVFGQSNVENKYFYPLSSLRFADLASDSDIATAMNSWITTVRKKDKLGAFNAGNRILDIMRQLGTRNLVSLSDICIAAGEVELDKGNYDAAVIAAEDSIKFAPDHPDAYFFMAKASFTADKADVKNIAPNIMSGIKAMFADRIQRDRLLSFSIRFAFLAAFLSFLVVFLAMFGRHYRSLLSDIAIFLPSKPAGIWRVILGGLTILIPLAVGGWLIFLLAIPLALWPYLRRDGRAVIAIFALFIFSAPYAFNFLAKEAVLGNADTYRALYLLSKDTWDYETKKTLERESLKDPDNELISFALGLLNNMRKDKNASIKAYDAVLKKRPTDLRALVNKGNAYFIAKEYSHAVEMYKKAIKVYPESVEAHFNLSNAYVRMFKTKDSEKEYKMALAIDKNKTNDFVELARLNQDKKVIDIPISNDDLSSFERVLAKKTEEISKILWNIYFGAISTDVYQKVASGFLILIILSHFLWKKAISHQTCPTCGSSFLPPIQLPSNDSRCNQCVAAQSSKSAVSTVKKDKKLKEIRQYAARSVTRAGLLDRLIPGVGRAVFQSHATALVFTFFTSLAIVYGSFTIFSDMVIYKTPVKDAVSAHVIFLGLAAFYWLLMNTAFKRDFY